MKVRALLEQRLPEIVRPVSQFLERVDALLVLQFFLLFAQRQPDKLHFPFLLGLELAFVGFVIFFDVVVSRFDFFEKIGRTHPHDADEIFAVKLLVVRFALAFGKRHARCDNLLDPLQAKLVMRELAQLLIGKTQRRKDRPLDLIILGAVKTRRTVKRWKISHCLDNVRLSRLNPEPLHLVPQHNQIDDEFRGFLIVRSVTGGQILAKIGNTEEIRQLKQARVALRFSHGNFATVHLREGIRTNEARIALHEINTERQGQDRDHDHEPVAMLTENFDHVRSGQFTNARAHAKCFSAGGTTSVSSEMLATRATPKENDRGVVTVNRWKMWQILAYWQTIGAKHKNNYGRDG